jgi:flagellar basal body-associated protein FliL
MQLAGGLQRGSTRPRRRRLNVLLAIMAIVVIAAMVALLVWAGAPARSEAGAEDANPNAGSAIIHDDAGNVHPD